jgi:benzaldehyde dehydrogenase (NAD)
VTADSSGTDERVFERRNPISGEVASTATAMTVDHALRVVDAAVEAQSAWAAKGPGEKRARLLKVADALARRGELLVDAMTKEIGATRTWGLFNVKLAISMITEAAALTTQISGEVIPSDRTGCLSMAVPQPVGVVLSIAPWNAPVILGIRSIATPLACGNAVVFKSSEICPNTHRILVEACTDGLLVDGLVGLVSNAPSEAANVVGALIDHPKIRRINFTGSTSVGRIVALRAAAQLKPVLLELGGKAPMLVLHDANMEEAVKAAAFGAFMNQGQICMSTERIIVTNAVADEFVQRFRDKVLTMKAANPGETDSALGAVVDQQAVSRVLDLVSDALDKGATLLVGGAPDGVIMPPHVVDHVTNIMDIYHKESFGPVVAILRATDEDEAIRLANDTQYGLSASVFTRDISRGLDVARRIQSGICHINGPTVYDEAQMPFGGMKGSGYGRFGGKAGVAEFTELRWLTVQSGPNHYPI